MSGGLLVLGSLAAASFAIVGLQVLARHLHRVPVDDRRPAPLVLPHRRKPEPAHSAELRRLVTVMANAILSERSAMAELQSSLDQLGTTTSPFDEDSTGPRRHRRRSQQIEATIAELERRWGIDQPTDAD